MRNNDFFEIKKVNSSLNLGIAIRAVIDDATVTTADCFVGTSATAANSFEDCRYGIMADGFDEVDISENTLDLDDGPFVRGIYVLNTINSAEISANTVTDFTDYGIKAEDNDETILDILDNTVSSVSTSASCDITAIIVTEATGVDVTFEIHGNIIDDVQIGIDVLNAETVIVEENIINFEQPGTCSGEEAFGIRTQNCDDNIIRDNTIDGGCSSCTNLDIVGIGVATSPGTLIRANLVEDCGMGVLLGGDCADGNAVCNELTNCYTGFFFKDVDDDEFGPVEHVSSAGEISDNKWSVAGTANRTYQNGASTIGNTLNWYYRDTGTTYDASLNNSGAGSFPAITFNSVSTSLDPCGFFVRLSDWGSEDHSRTTISTSFQTLLDSIDASGAPSNMPSVAYSYLALAHLREQMETVILDLLGHTNIAELDEIESALQEEDLVETSVLLRSISTTMEREILKKTILGIILSAKEHRLLQEFQTTDTVPRTLANFLSTKQLATVDSIASLDAERTGDAVYMARAILGRTDLEIDEHVDRLNSALESLEPASIQSFPNPVIQSVTVTAEVLPLIELALHDANGRLLISRKLHSDWMSTLDLGMLSNGMYLIRAKHSDGTYSSLLVSVSHN